MLPTLSLGPATLGRIIPIFSAGRFKIRCIKRLELGQPAKKNFIVDLLGGLGFYGTAFEKANVSLSCHWLSDP